MMVNGTENTPTIECETRVLPTFWGVNRLGVAGVSKGLPVVGDAEY